MLLRRVRAGRATAGRATVGRPAVRQMLVHLVALESCLFLFLAGCGETSSLSKRTRLAQDADVRVSAEQLGKDWEASSLSLCGAEAKPRFYGEQTLLVPAKTFGTNTNLYVRAGDEVRFSASGEWTIWEGETTPFSADGLVALGSIYGCQKGALIAYIGLDHRERGLCLGAEASFTATEEGLVYLAMNDDSSPLYHGGGLQVTVSSNGIYAPTIKLAGLTEQEVCSYGAPVVEIETLYNDFVLPSERVLMDIATARSSLALFDQAYVHLRELASGNQPYGGERIRWLADPSIEAEGWIIGGNPVRYDPRNLDLSPPSRAHLLQSSLSGMSIWDFMKGLGHAFSRVLGTRFHADLASSQAWSTLFAVAAVEGLKREASDDRIPTCRDTAADRLTALAASEAKTCLLVELKLAYGWGLIGDFYDHVATVSDWDLALGPEASPGEKWDWFQGNVDRLTGADNGALFNKYAPFLE